MAAKVRIETRAQRSRLPINPKPVYVRVLPGVMLGYRRNTHGGSWVVKVADGKGSSWTRNIGRADDDAGDEGALSYWAAIDRAKQVAIGAGVHTSDTSAEPPLTLSAALDLYEADLHARGGEAKNAIRVRRHMPPRLLARLVADLTVNDLRRWRDGLTVISRSKVQPAEKRSMAPGTVNRTTNALKACLNHAADRDGRITSRRAWTVGLQAIRGAGRARNVILSNGDVRKLVEAAYGQSEQFGLLIEALATTGARISQIRSTRVDDLRLADENPRLMIPASRKGRGTKAIPRRPVPIGEDLAMKLWAAVASRKTHGPLFERSVKGDAWGRSDHLWPFARIVKATGVRGAEGGSVTAYALRHTSIVRQLLAGIPVRVVASGHDTSVAMIEAHYSAFITDSADAVVRAALPNF